MVVAGGGNLDQGFGTVQYGGSLGKDTDFRVYSKYFNQDHSPACQRSKRGRRLAYAARWISDRQHSLGEGYIDGSRRYFHRAGKRYPCVPTLPSPRRRADKHSDAPAEESGGFFQGVWSHTYSARSDTTLSASYSTYESDDVLNSSPKGEKHSVSISSIISLGVSGKTLSGDWVTNTRRRIPKATSLSP